MLLPRAADPDRGGRFMMVLRSRKNASPAKGLVKKSAMLAVVETNGYKKGRIRKMRTGERTGGRRVSALQAGGKDVAAPHGHWGRAAKAKGGTGSVAAKNLDPDLNLDPNGARGPGEES